MVDIGGEIVAKGKNSRNGLWRIGINKPIDDSLSVNQEIQTILELSDAGLATSGNYRNFYYKDGKKYAHTIDPRTGYPVMGLEEASAFANAHPAIDAYFIYSDENGKFQTFFTDGMKKYMPAK